MDCSVVVCTRDNRDSLRRTLAALSQQCYDAGRFEIVVVDNGSTDGTIDVVAQATDSSPQPIRYVDCPEAGLSLARNRGMEAAGGELVCFIDDDAVPRRSDWASVLAATYEDPRVAAAGGDADPIWPDGAAPEWLHRLLWYNVGITRFDDRRERLCRYPDYPFGANLSFRKNAAVAVGGFSTRLGRVDQQARSGEEQELCLRLQKAGHRIVYTPDAAVDHYVSAHKLDRAWLRERSIWEGKGRSRIEAQHLSWLPLTRRRLRHLGVLAAAGVGVAVFSQRSAPALATLSRCQLELARHYLSGLVTQRRS